MKTLLVVDDDIVFCEVLTESLTAKGYEVATSHNVQEALIKAEAFNPEWVLTDLKMPGLSGLEFIPKLLEIDPATRIVVLTGYASISTAVEAIKLGAVHYLAKPAGTEEILAAFLLGEGNPKAPIEENLSLNSAEREHILAALRRNQNNISATARELGLHRRTLQRKLDKMR